MEKRRFIGSNKPFWKFCQRISLERDAREEIMSKCIWGRWDKNSKHYKCIDPTVRAGERCAICCHYRERKRHKEKGEGQ